MSTNGPAPTRRVNHGRGHSYYLDGEKVTSITKALGTGFPKPALVDWAARETAGRAIDTWDELADLPPSKRLERLLRARFDSQQEASARGTLIHDYAHRLAAGEALDIPDEYLGHVDSYLKFVHDWQPRELMVEQPVYSKKWRYAGTPDLVAGLADGRIWLLDYKTGAKGGVYLEHVLQLAAARYAEFTLDADGNRVKLPPIDAAGIIWLRADGYDLYPVEADERAHRIFLYVKQIAEFVDADRQDWVGDALMPPVRDA